MLCKPFKFNEISALKTKQIKKLGQALRALLKSCFAGPSGYNNRHWGHLNLLIRPYTLFLLQHVVDQLSICVLGIQLSRHNVSRHSVMYAQFYLGIVTVYQALCNQAYVGILLSRHLCTRHSRTIQYSYILLLSGPNLALSNISMLLVMVYLFIILLYGEPGVLLCGRVQRTDPTLLYLTIGVNLVSYVSQY